MQALTWLQLELERLKYHIASGNVTTGLQGLGFLLSASCFSGVRDLEALAELTKDEAEEWKAFWEEVREIMDAPY